MRFGSLFSGIGGLDLGLERAGMECAWQVEIDPYCRRVLEKHWPDVPKFGDVHDLTGAELAGVDLIAGGFPCQPVSQAGRRLAQDDERWLWPEFARIVRLLRPRYVFVENVPGLLVRGMGDVLGDLAGLGYDAEWESVPAAAVGAPHLRYRVWIVGHSDDGGSHGGVSDSERNKLWVERERHGEQHQEPGPTKPREHGAQRLVAHSDSRGREVERLQEPAGEQGSRWGQPDGRGEVRELEHAALADADSSGPQGRYFGGERTRECVARTGRLPDTGDWLPEPDVGRVAHGVPRRVDRLRALGNAVVPQVAEWIGRRILEWEAA